MPNLKATFVTRYKAIKTGLIVLFLTILSGCSSPVRPLQHVEVPEAWLTPCQHPKAPLTASGGLLNGGLALWLKEYQLALDLCNADKAAIKGALESAAKN